MAVPFVKRLADSLARSAVKQGSGEALVNATVARCGAVLLLAAAVLTGAAWLRGAEYDEQYTLFLTAGVARPAWPDNAFTAGAVRAAAGGPRQPGGHRPGSARAPTCIRRCISGRWRCGGGCSDRRCSPPGCCRWCAVWRRWRRSAGSRGARGFRRRLAMLLTLGCYGFAYTGAIARGFALAQALTLAGMLVVLRGRGRRGPTFWPARCWVPRRQAITWRCLPGPRRSWRCLGGERVTRERPLPLPLVPWPAGSGPLPAPSLAVAGSVVLPGTARIAHRSVPAVSPGQRAAPACHLHGGEPARRLALVCRCSAAPSRGIRVRGTAAWSRGR